MTPEELFTEWGRAWTARDTSERLRHLEACCIEDVEFVPPDDRPVFRGRQALADHIGEYTAGWPPGVTATLARPPDTHHGWSRGFVRFTFPTTTAIGCDIMRIEDGKIATMLVFTDASPSHGCP